MLPAWIVPFLLASLLIQKVPAASSPDKPVVALRVESNRSFGAEILVKQLLERGGLTTADSSDVTLNVELRAEALSQEYSRFMMGPGARYYTGAWITGTLLLEAPNRPASEGKFSGGVSPPFSVKGWGPTDAGGAPFAEAFRVSDFYRVLGEAIGKTLGPKLATAYWLGAMTVPDYRTAAADALGALGPAALEPVLDAVRHGRISEADAAGVLAKTGDPALLVTAVNDFDPRVRACVVEALGRVENNVATELLVRIITEDLAATVRASALKSLARMMTRLKQHELVPFYVAVIPAVESALASDPDPRVRNAAAETLGNSGYPPAVPALQRSLRVDKDATVRLRVLLSIMRLDKSAVTSLIAALQDADASVRQSAAEALGKAGDQSCIGPLIVAMRGQPISTRRVIAGVLKEMTNEDFGLDYQAWSKWWADDEQRAWLAAPPLHVVFKARRPCTIDLSTGDQHKYGIVAAADSVSCNAKDSVTVLVFDPQCWDIFVNGVQTVVEFDKSDNPKYPYAAVITSKRATDH